MEVTSHVESSSATQEVKDEHELIDSKYSWLICASSFFLLFLSIGIENSFGIYQQHYIDEAFSSSPPAKVAWIGTLTTSSMLAISVISNRAAIGFGFRVSVWMGGSFAALGLFLASFGKSIIFMIFTQGLMFGIGAGFLYSIPITITSMYFEKYRGLALGIITAGSGIGGLAISNMIHAVIKSIGFRWALRITAIMTLVIAWIAAIPFKPVAGFAENFKLIDFSAFRSPVYWCILVTGFFANLGYVVPIFFLSTVAVQLGASSSFASMIVSVLSLGFFFGSLAMGQLADILGAYNVFAFSTFIAGFIQLALWVLYKSPASLAVVSFFYGFFISGYVALGVAVIARHFDHEKLSPYTGTYLSFSGCVIIIGNLVTTLLLDNLGKGVNYNYLAIMSCTVLMLAGLACVPSILYIRKKAPDPKTWKI